MKTRALEVIGLCCELLLSHPHFPLSQSKSKTHRHLTTTWMLISPFSLICRLREEDVRPVRLTPLFLGVACWLAESSAWRCARFMDEAADMLDEALDGIFGGGILLVPEMALCSPVLVPPAVLAGRLDMVYRYKLESKDSRAVVVDIQLEIERKQILLRQQVRLLW